MADLFSLPERAYRAIDAQFGAVGLIAAGLMIAVALIGVFIWLDRRK